MKFAIQINSGPQQSSAALTAYRFICAALAGGHEIFRIFFYHEGIYHGWKYNMPPDDEVNMTRMWSELARAHRIDLVVCISAAQRRGLLSFDEAKRQHKLDDDLADGFRISGLGQWVEAILETDRFLVFG